MRYVGTGVFARWNSRKALITTSTAPAMIGPPATYCQGAGTISTGQNTPSTTPMAIKTKAITGGGAMAPEESFFESLMQIFRLFRS